MPDFQTVKNLAIETMRKPPEVTSKLAALDGLDRLALNPSDWFPEAVLKHLTDARVSIIVDRWRDALETLEETYTAMEGFIEVLEGKSEGEEALQRARDELAQCAKVQVYVGKRSADPDE